MPVNTQWFKDRLAEQGKSQAALARHMDIDKASLTRIFQGKRRLQLEECKKVARFLSVPVDMILENAGIQLRQKTRGGRTLFPVVGQVSETSEVLLDAGDTSISTEINIPSECVALRLRDPEGWTAFMLNDRQPPEMMILRLVVASCPDGSLWMGELRRGYELGTFTLAPLRGDPIEGVSINYCQPVVWVRPSQ